MHLGIDSINERTCTGGTSFPSLGLVESRSVPVSHRSRTELRSGTWVPSSLLSSLCHLEVVHFLSFKHLAWIVHWRLSKPVHEQTLLPHLSESPSAVITSSRDWTLVSLRSLLIRSQCSRFNSRVLSIHHRSVSEMMQPYRGEAPPPLKLHKTNGHRCVSCPFWIRRLSLVVWHNVYSYKPAGGRWNKSLYGVGDRRKCLIWLTVTNCLQSAVCCDSLLFICTYQSKMLWYGKMW